MGSIADLLGQRVYLDANLFIYALENLEPWATSARAIMRHIDEGRLTAVTSELTLAECLVKPMKDDAQPLIDVYLAAIQPRAHLIIAPISREILIFAARMRAQEGIKLPDAIHISTAKTHACPALLTNDQRMSEASGLNASLFSELHQP